MSLQMHVPADVEPTTMTELVEDCREVSGVLGLPASETAVPRQAHPGESPDLDVEAVAVLEGWGSYGS